MLGLVSLAVSVLLIAGLFGLVPNSRLQEQQARRVFCESTAVTFLSLAERMDTDGLQKTLDQIRNRTKISGGTDVPLRTDILSIGYRDSDGELVLQSGPHTDLWQSTGRDPVINNEYIVPINAGNAQLGRLEVHWVESEWVVMGIPLRPDFVLTMFVGLILLLVFSAYLKKVLKHISPSKVVPTRVRDALNSLSEGLLVLDRNHSIVLANESFANATGAASEDLIGKKPSLLNFAVAGGSGD